MPGPLLLEVFGHQFSVRLADLPEAEAEALRRQWSRCAATRPAGRDEPVEVPLSGVDDPVRRDYALASAVTFAAIRQAAGSGVMLHACGVARPKTGQVAVLVAASGTGKTTAAARLCADDFGYVTDETVLIRPDRSVLPYPKPLSVVLAADDPYHKQQHGPDELGLQPPPPQLHAAALILLDRVGRADADPPPTPPAALSELPTLEPLGLIDTMLALIPQTSSLMALERPMAALAETVVALGGGQVLRYRDIEDAAGLIDDSLDADHPRPSFTAIPGDAPGGDEANGDGVVGDGAAGDGAATDLAREWEAWPAQPGEHRPELADDRLILRSPFQDAIRADEEVLVLTASIPLRLTGLGATIWSTAARPVTVRELVARCQSVHGAHERADGLVRSAIDELLGAQALLVGRATDRSLA